MRSVIFTDFSSSSWEYTWMKQHYQKLRGYDRIITCQYKKCTKSVLMRSKFKNMPKKVNYVKNIMAMFYPGMYNDLGRKKNPANNRMNYLSSGAGFLPSTASSQLFFVGLVHQHVITQTMNTQRDMPS